VDHVSQDTVVFYFMFRHIDKEEYKLSENGDYHLTSKGSGTVVTEAVLDKSTKPTLAVTEKGELGIFPKH
jgi:hypothetical protein